MIFVELFQQCALLLSPLLPSICPKFDQIPDLEIVLFLDFECIRNFNLLSLRKHKNISLSLSFGLDIFDVESDVVLDEFTAFGPVALIFETLDFSEEVLAHFCVFTTVHDKSMHLFTSSSELGLTFSLDVGLSLLYF